MKPGFAYQTERGGWGIGMDFRKSPGVPSLHPSLLQIPHGQNHSEKKWTYQSWRIMIHDLHDLPIVVPVSIPCWRPLPTHRR